MFIIRKIAASSDAAEQQLAPVVAEKKCQLVRAILNPLSTTPEKVKARVIHPSMV